MAALAPLSANEAGRGLRPVPLKRSAPLPAPVGAGHEQEDVMDSVNLVPQPWRPALSPGGTGSTPSTGQPQSSETPPSGTVAAAGQHQTVAAAPAAAEVSKSADHRDQDRQQVKDAVKDINDFLQNVNRTLQFKLDEDTGQMVVQIKDTTTDEVIRQIPSEKALEIAKQLDQLKGLLFKEKA